MAQQVVTFHGLQGTQATDRLPIALKAATPVPYFVKFLHMISVATQTAR